MTTGFIADISQEWRGDSLLEDAASGDTVLYLDDAADFSEDFSIPRYLIVGGEDTPRQYVGVDMDADTVTLAATVGGSGLESDLPVVLWDPTVGEGGDRVVEYVADVLLHDDSGTVPSVVPHELIPASGVYGLVGASVSIDQDEADEDGDWYIDRVLGREPVVDLNYGDPTTFPEAPEPVDPPASSPVVTLSGNDVGLVGRFDTVPASTLVEWHVWDSTTGDETYEPTQADPDTLYVTSRSAVQPIDRLPNGQLLVEAETYYVATWALNSAGYAADPSVVAVGQMDMSRTRDLVLGELVAGFILTGRIEVGSMSIDADEGMVFRDENGDPFITLPVDGTATADIYAFIRAAGITIEDNANLYGLAQEFGTFRLANGITDPAVKAQVSRTWEKLTTFVADQDSAAFRFGYTQSSDDSRGVTMFALLGSGTIERWDTSTGAQTGTTSLPDFYATGGITRVGTSYYALGQDFARSQDWYVYAFNSSFTKTGEFLVTDTPPAIPAIGTDGTNLLVAYARTNGDECKVLSYTTGGSLNGFVDCVHNLNDAFNVAGVFQGSADFGATRIVIQPQERAALVFNTSGARQTSNEFSRASNAKMRGLWWDGARFKSTDDSGRVWDYATGHAATSTIYGGYTWFDADTSSGSSTHETAVSVGQSFSWPARARLVVTGQPAPDAGITDPTKLDKANLVRIYAGTSASTMRLQDGGGTTGALPLGTVSLSMESLDTGSAVAPTSSDFGSAGATPGVVESAELDGVGDPLVALRGDGSWRLDPLEGDGAGGFTRGIDFGQTASAGSISAGSSADVVVTFSSTFSSAPTVVVSTRFQWVPASVVSVTTTQATIRFRNFHASSSFNPSGDWIAVGA